MSSNSTLSCNLGCETSLFEIVVHQFYQRFHRLNPEGMQVVERNSDVDVRNPWRNPSIRGTYVNFDHRNRPLMTLVSPNRELSVTSSG